MTTLASTHPTVLERPITSPAGRDRLGDRHTIGIFKVSAHGQPAGDPGHPDRMARRRACQLTLHIERRGLPFQRGVGGQDHFPYPLGLEASQQVRHMQVVRAYAIQWRQAPAQHVVQTPEFPGPLDGRNVTGLFHHTERGRIPARIGAQMAQGGLGEVVAPLTATHTLGECHQCVRQIPALGRRLPQQ